MDEDLCGCEAERLQDPIVPPSANDSLDLKSGRTGGDEYEQEADEKAASATDLVLLLKR